MRIKSLFLSALLMFVMGGAQAADALLKPFVLASKGAGTVDEKIAQARAAGSFGGTSQAMELPGGCRVQITRRATTITISTCRTSSASPKPAPCPGPVAGITAERAAHRNRRAASARIAQPGGPARQRDYFLAPPAKTTIEAVST